MTKKLSGKVAIVTGASKGIGSAIAKHLAAEGAAVVVNYASSKSGADKVVAEIVKGGGKAAAIQADVSHPKEIEKLFAETKRLFGSLDILVNNAGVYDFVPLEEVTVEHFNKIFDINVLGLILTTKEALKYFGASASVINISSVASRAAMANASVYSASKGAVDVITKCLAKELGPKNIRVNSVNPGLVITEGVDSKGFSSGEFKDVTLAHTPLGRVGLPIDIAPLVTYLASNDSSWVTGETFVISGGFT